MALQLSHAQHIQIEYMIHNIILKDVQIAKIARCTDRAIRRI